MTDDNTTKTPEVLKLASNGRQRTLKSNAKKWAETGSPGLEIWSGFVNEAYHSDLYWPACYPLYNRIRRADPEISIVRVLFVSLARRLKMIWVPDTDEPTSGDTEAAAFGNEAMLDLDGGPSALLETVVSYLPFMGWGWWEIVPGLRRKDWRPPDDDPWRSRYDDGLLAIRRLAWRDHSSFARWDIDDASGRLFGMWQRDVPNPEVLLPLEQSMHLKFGDNVNPEGLSPLEAVWRLERIKYGLEIIQGIGFEHAAGYLNVTSEADQITSSDKAAIKKVARAILSASEGNFATWPKGFNGEIKDIDFSAASSILDAIKYYGILKLQIYIMQWIALSSTSGVGSFAAKKEDTTMFVLFFNAMMDGFADQMSTQLGPWLFDRNREHWPDLTANPKLTISPLEKVFDLKDLTAWVTSLFTIGFPLDDQDLLWIREKAGMREELPEEEDGEPAVDEVPDTSSGSMDSDEGDAEDMIEEGDVRGAMSQFRRWADHRAPWISGLLGRKVKFDEQPTDLSMPVPARTSKPTADDKELKRKKKAMDKLLNKLMSVVEEMNKSDRSQIAELAKAVKDSSDRAAKEDGRPIQVNLPDSLKAEFQAPDVTVRMPPTEDLSQVVSLLTELIGLMKQTEQPVVEVNLPEQSAPQVRVEPVIEVTVPKQEAPKVEITNEIKVPVDRTETIEIVRGRGNLITKLVKKIKGG